MYQRQGSIDLFSRQVTFVRNDGNGKKRFIIDTIHPVTTVTNEKNYNNEKTSVIDDTKICPECSGTVFFDDTIRGEKLCGSCGIVLRERTIVNNGARVFDHEDIEKKVHYEPLTEQNRMIIVVKKTASPDMKRRASQNNRVPWSIKRIQIMKAEIMKLKTYLPITKDIEDWTMREVHKVFENSNILQGRNLISIGTALLYYVCIQSNSTITFDDILQHSKEKRKSLRLAISKLSDRGTMNPLQPYKFTQKSNYGNYFSNVASNLKIPYNICNDALKMYRMMKNVSQLRGDPRGWIGAFIYHSCKNHNEKEKKTQQEIANVIGIAEGTIRKKARIITDFINNNRQETIQIP